MGAAVGAKMPRFPLPDRFLPGTSTQWDMPETPSQGGCPESIGTRCLSRLLTAPLTWWNGWRAPAIPGAELPGVHSHGGVSYGRQLLSDDPDKERFRPPSMSRNQQDWVLSPGSASRGTTLELGFAGDRLVAGTPPRGPVWIQLKVMTWDHSPVGPPPAGGFKGWLCALGCSQKQVPQRPKFCSWNFAFLWFIKYKIKRKGGPQSRLSSKYDPFFICSWFTAN